MACHNRVSLSSAPKDLVHTGPCVQSARVTEKNSGRKTGSQTFILCVYLVLPCIRCKKCKGNKTVKEKNRQEIYIERGMADRQRIVLAGAGDEEVSPSCSYSLED